MSNLPPYPGGNDTPDGESGQPDGGSSEPSWGATPPQSPYGEQQPPPPSPYGQQQPPPPYGQNPYGQNPYGQGQWGGPGGGYGAYQGPNDAAGQSYSGLAIAALVLSFTCLLSWLGVILGVVALFKTGKGKAKGLWMAVTAIVVGLLLSLVLVAIMAGAFWLRGQVIVPDNAEAGQCVETDEEDDEVFMWKLDCADDHDAEIVGRHTITASEARGGFASAMEVCERMLREDFPEAYADGGEALELLIMTENSGLEVGENMACYIEPRDGSKMTEHVLG